jgi:predicted DNA-binding transcriptional regulator YafY
MTKRSEGGSKRPSPGRPGSIDRARMLVAILGTLEKEGDSISADVIADRFGISLEEARRDIQLLAGFSGDAGFYLPTYLSDDGSTLTLAFNSDVHGRPCRLSLEETNALLVALDRVGIPDDDPVRQTIVGSLGARTPDANLVAPLIATDDQGANPEISRACADALLEGSSLTFLYQGMRDPAPVERHVDPYGTHHANGDWYLDGFDLDRQADRMFRFDRMGDVRQGGKRTPHAHARPTEQRLVGIHFADASWTTLFDWHRLGPLTKDADGTLSGRIVSYGGMWLARHIAACGGAVWVDDEETMAQARAFAREQLRSGASDGNGR